jgi:hypothetical protein
MKTMKKILTLILLTLSVLGFSQTLEVERNLKINENLITTGENLLPDRVITLDTTNDKVTETNVMKVTSLSFQNVADSISKNNTFDSLNVTYNVDAKVINADSVDCEVFEADEVIILNSTSETTPASAGGIGVENDNATANRVNRIGFSANKVFQSGMLNTWVDANTNNLSLYNWTGGAISRKLYLKDDTTFLGKDEAVTILPNGDVELSNNIQINDSSKFNITTVNQIYFTNRDSIVDNSGDIMLDLSGTNIIKVEIDENSEMDWQNAKTGSYRIEITNSDASEHTVSFADAKWYIEENEEGSITIPVSGVVMLGLYYNGYQMIVEGYNTYILYEL